MKGVLNSTENEWVRFVMIRDSGHYVVEEQLEVTAEQMLKFIEDVERNR